MARTPGALKLAVMRSTDPRPETAPGHGDGDGDARAGQAAKQAEPTQAAEPAEPTEPAQPVRSVRPEQAREDTDVAWGEYPERDDERLYRDRPPHWADF